MQKGGEEERGMQSVLRRGGKQRADGIYHIRKEEQGERKRLKIAGSRPPHLPVSKPSCLARHMDVRGKGDAPDPHPMEKVLGRGTVPGAFGEAEGSRRARRSSSAQESQGIRGAAAAGAIEPVHDEIGSSGGGWRNGRGDEGRSPRGGSAREKPVHTAASGSAAPLQPDWKHQPRSVEARRFSPAGAACPSVSSCWSPETLQQQPRPDVRRSCLKQK